MRVLKAFVIGMAAVIVIGLAVLVYGLAHHWNKSEESADAAPPAPPGQIHAPLTDGDANATTAPFNVSVPTPEGMHFEQMVATGGRTLLRFSGPQGEHIVVIDPHSGRVTGTIGVAAPGK